MNVEDLFAQSNDGLPENAKPKQSPLNSLKADLDIYKESIKDISVTLLEEGYTSYPIFVAHQHEVSIGELILDKNELGTSWTIQASSLEEFIERDLIKAERKDYFIKQFKPAEDYMCLFVVVPEGANFVFYPYA